ncbi:hypothetical protein PGTUg99_019822 [Puccinia graminis f. sp. tritici]|uniref:Uncharacterized protein n=1 Tax=Puccinia graminis f. sp. tritici TaxID=56615 RepID=A0A5B0R805_PUCGR|nr:hypothetical protein PGTUg99_019822 [Puccinia graminis f. sp. tritici]
MQGSAPYGHGHSLRKATGSDSSATSAFAQTDVKEHFILHPQFPQQSFPFGLFTDQTRLQ